MRRIQLWGSTMVLLATTQPTQLCTQPTSNENCSDYVFTSADLALAAPNEVAPVEVKPIHITIDVNVKIDRELDNYLDDIFEAGDDIRQQQGISQ